MSGLRDPIYFLAAIGNLSLAVTAAFAGRKSPLARPLAALCFVLFGWNFSTLAHHVVRTSAGEAIDAFDVLDACFTALSPPLALEVVLAFVGESRRRRPIRLAAWLVSAVLVVSALGAVVSPSLVGFSDSAAWSSIFLVGYVPTLAFEVVLLGRYLRSTADVREKARARTALLALAIGGAFSLSDVTNHVGLDLPYLGALGTLISSALLTTLVVRFELLDRNVSARTTMYVLGMIVAFVVAYLIVFSAFAGKLAVQVFAACILTLIVAAAARELALSVAEARARTQRLAVLGRFSAQMAHDIKGPLTALVGAVQVLEGEKDEATQKEFLDLVSEQAKRIGAIVDRYDRMARVEPQKTLVRVNALVRSIARSHQIPDDAAHLVAGSGPEGETLECEVDRALYESAIENVIRNAVEASKDATLVKVATEVDAQGGWFVVRVTDRGPGMDARTLERATEDFFTTKATGSGLGLAFARRVLEAHGGTLILTSRLGEGTKVELRIPYNLSEPPRRSG